MKKDNFNVIIENINNKKLQELKNEKHHGIDRYTHSYRVAKYSYKIGKVLKFKNLEKMTEAAFIHDFYFNSELIDNNEREKLRLHGHLALNNAKKLIELSPIQENIIESHMFPFGGVRPNCKEAICVALVDKGVATGEILKNKIINKAIVFDFSVSFLFLINVIKNINL